MVVSDSPIDWNFERWRHVLDAYVIDGKKQFDGENADDRAFLDKLMAIDQSSAHLIEDCHDVLARTLQMNVVTDDNMGTEWRHPLNLD
jgi:spermidine synthase